MPTAYMRGQGNRGEQAPKAPPPEGVVLTPPPTGGMKGGYGDEVDEFLHTTQRPDEPMERGVRAPRAAPPPEDILPMLPALVKASREPGAPPEIALFLRQLRALMGV
jgi:hypothetical protein